MAVVAPSTFYTEASRRFQEELLNLVPGTLNGGLYANKAGYHNLRKNLPIGDYSIRALIDKQGPNDKSAAHDWTFPEAQRGDYSRISLYMGRVRNAWVKKDPRLKGWREILGQADLDEPPEGYDFDSWTSRVPDDSHKWHIHLSEHRAHTESWDNKRAMLSVFRGESLSDWLAGEGTSMLCTYGDIDPADPREGRVATLQARLWFLGYDIGTSGIDGKYGDKTRDALKVACATVGWETDGTKFWAGEYAALEKTIILHWAPTNGGSPQPPVLVPHTHPVIVKVSVTGSGEGSAQTGDATVI